MAFIANVLRVMIASPSDVTAERDAVESAIHEWNGANAEKRRTTLLPWRWEADSVPMVGDHPQSLLNGQGVDTSDIVIALFWSRLGSPTPEAESGTVEEIERARTQGKLVHVYFSEAAYPHEVDTEQLDRLRTYRNDLQHRSLLGTFTTVDELQRRVARAITQDVEELAADPPVLLGARRGVSFVVQPRQEREPSGSDSSGRLKYTTREWVEVTNDGDEDAEEVLFESVGDQPRLHVLGNDGPTTIHRGQTRRVTVASSWNGGDQPIFRIRWTEAGEQMHRDFHVG